MLGALSPTRELQILLGSCNMRLALPSQRSKVRGDPSGRELSVFAAHADTFLTSTPTSPQPQENYFWNLLIQQVHRAIPQDQATWTCCKLALYLWPKSTHLHFTFREEGLLHIPGRA